MFAKHMASFILAAGLALLAGCGSSSVTSSLSPAVAATDYSRPEHWLALPAPEKAVDVFYFYPTAWKNSNPQPEISAIDDASMKIGAAEAYALQATAFEPVGNVFAPYYRQDNTSPIDREKTIDGVPTMDGIAAFDYYIRNYNGGRPFILVGHSQGANVLSNLLARYMKAHPDVYQRMIAAYVIGYAVTDAYLARNPHLKFAEGPADTGVIVSWNTQAPDVAPGANPVLYAGVGRVINPISWRTDETEAATGEGVGSYMPVPPTMAFAEVPQYADAKIDKAKGVLICSTADEEAMYALSGALGKGVYHSFDIPFYYFNLRANAANRAAVFLANPYK